MDAAFWLAPAMLGSSLLTAAAIFLMPAGWTALRNACNLAGAAVKVALAAVAVAGTLGGTVFETRLHLLLGFDFLLRIDMMSLLMVCLSTGLWFVTTCYAIGYMAGTPNQSRFFGFFSLCVTASVGVAMAGNLVTFFVFYEFLTLSTYPLVVHEGSPKALQAGRVYLSYTLAGGVVLLVGLVWLTVLAGSVDFTPGGVLGSYVSGQLPALTGIFVLLIAGLGVKSALVPLHGWLPQAMVAPAPVSALLHAVAVVKAGVFGIVRVVFDLFGVHVAAAMDVLTPLALVAAVTIVWGSICALRQDDLKRILAYSTVSQLSYIVLGAAMVGLTATTGSIVHLVHQGITKITLFFCAGAIQSELGLKKVSELGGVGRRMPLTMAAFTVAAFGMMGAPPTSGFVTKWYLGLGGLESGGPWVVAVLVASTVLNAAYFLPVLRVAWFDPPATPLPPRQRLLEARGWLLWPLVATGLASLAAGLFAGSSYSPLALAQLIARSMYGP